MANSGYSLPAHRLPSGSAVSDSLCPLHEGFPVFSVSMPRCEAFGSTVLKSLAPMRNLATLRIWRSKKASESWITLVRWPNSSKLIVPNS